jgi:hypothetical protein
MAAAALLPQSDSPAGNPRPDLAGPCALPIDICEEFVAETLKPYRANAKYLKSAQITQIRDPDRPAKGSPLATAVGRFSIPESCYIDDTGHFNAVEFNICYNQLAYVMFGKCFETGVVPKLRFVTLPQYRQHQLQSCFIVSLESRFLQQLDSRDFRGELTVNKVSSAGGMPFGFTSITFSDAEGVKAHGQVVLAFNPPTDATKH